MTKTVDVEAPLCEMLEMYPELKQILKRAGFREAENPYKLKIAAKSASLAHLMERNHTSFEQMAALLQEKGLTLQAHDDAADQPDADHQQPLLYQSFDNAQKEIQVEHQDMNQIEEGHPLQTLQKENECLRDLIEKISDEIAQGKDPADALLPLKPLPKLYSFIEEVIMPMLYRYGFYEYTDDLWKQEEDARHTMSRIVHKLMRPGSDVPAETKQLLAKISDIANQQDNTLYPLALDHFQKEEWVQIYLDLKREGSAFLCCVPVWPYGEDHASLFKRPEGIDAVNGTIRLERGTLTFPQLKAILDKLPVDLTFIDDNDMNRYFLDNGRIFLRPSTALDRPVRDCHPPRVQIALANLLKDFKSGKRDHMEIWSEHPFPVHVHYLALHDDDGKYIGALEIVQKCDEIASHFSKPKAQ
ncbi:MAG: PAS domain-containing protein [Lactimicrobium sp.]|jgi:DUF438 domain-containing protein|uniref:PAS domain-containing protein n=1 Tax=Lactimicrobium sp. TaxID=2563780 RepID=UPI002F35A729